MLLEYCAHGTLFDLIEEKCAAGLSGISDERELYKIVNDVANGLRALHSQQIAHRDVKIENVLKGHDQNWKLCDFGSCTKKHWTAKEVKEMKDVILDEINKMTTPIYRAPEQCDLFKNTPIDTKVDIWALGCLMFTLMYHRPPFDETSRLAQINGKYFIPHSPPYSTECISLLQGMLEINPAKRLSAQQVYETTLTLSGNVEQTYQFG